MAKIDRCPECGSRYIGEAVLSNATLYPKGKGWSGSKVRAEVCSNCGLVIRWRVDKPEKFFNDES